MAPHLRLLSLVLLVVLSGCSGERAGESGAAPASPSMPAEPEEEVQSTLRIHNLRLSAGPEAGSDRLRVLFDESTSALRVTVTGGIDQDNQSVSVCSVADETEIPPSTQCVMPADGRTVDLPAGSQIRGAEIVLAGRTTLVDITELALTFTADSRQVKVLMPNIAPSAGNTACSPDGCPALEMTLPREGVLSAEASWAEPGAGLLEILTAPLQPVTGATPETTAYTVVSSSGSSSDSGPGSVGISANIGEEESARLTLSNPGSTVLPAPVLVASWP